jgi:basic membrane protein A
VFCAGLVTASGSIEIDSNREAWLGLQDTKADGWLDRADAIETVDARDRLKNIETLAEDGYDVIVTVGAAISEETIAAAREYPQTLFIGIEQPQEETLHNLTGLVFHEEQGGFLAGVLAATVTQTDRLAAVCEAKFIDAMRRYCDGFQAGAHDVKPEVHIDVTYREGPTEDLFNDPDWGRKTALQLVDDGTDVLFAAGGGTADAALEAAAGEGAYVIGSETDVYLRLTDIRPRLVSSAINDIRSGVRELMRLAKKGQFPSGDFFGQVNLAPFHEFEGQIPPTTLERLQEIQRGLENKSIQVGVPYKSP